MQAETDRKTVGCCGCNRRSVRCDQQLERRFNRLTGACGRSERRGRRERVIVSRTLSPVRRECASPEPKVSRSAITALRRSSFSAAPSSSPLVLLHNTRAQKQHAFRHWQALTHPARTRQGSRVRKGRRESDRVARRRRRQVDRLPLPDVRGLDRSYSALYQTDQLAPSARQLRRRLLCQAPQTPRVPQAAHHPQPQHQSRHALRHGDLRVPAAGCRSHRHPRTPLCVPPPRTRMQSPSHPARNRACTPLRSQQSIDVSS